MRVETPSESMQTNKPKARRGKAFFTLLIIAALIIIVQQAFDTSSPAIEADAQGQNVLGEAATQSENTVRVRLSEDELNKRLQEQIGQSSQDSTLADINVDLQNGLGRLTMRWKSGQTLEADIVVGESAKELVVENARVVNAGVFNAAFEGLAKPALDQGLKIITNKSGDRLVRIELVPDALHAFYLLEQ